MVVVYVEGIPIEIRRYESKTKMQQTRSIQDEIFQAIRNLKMDSSNPFPPVQLRQVPSGLVVPIAEVNPSDTGTYIVDEAGWQEKMQHLIRREKQAYSRGYQSDKKHDLHDDELPENLDLPPNVFTSVQQLKEMELRPSIFGGIPGAELVQFGALRQDDIDDVIWIKKSLRRGINFSKCSRKATVEPRVLTSNPTFTVFTMTNREGGSKSWFGGYPKKFDTSSIVTLVKGKASQELEHTSAAISPHVCLCIGFNNRTLSMIFQSQIERDRVTSGLANLLGKAVVEQDDVL